MSCFLVNGAAVDTPPDFVIRMVRNNSMFLDEALEGDYSYTITLPATDRNRVIFSYFEKPESTETKPEYSCEYIEHGITLIRGKLEIKKANHNQYECYILSGLSKLAAVKDDQVGTLDIGGIQEIRGLNQEINLTLTAPDGMGQVLFAYANGFTTNITVTWTTDANTTLNLLKTQIDLLTPTKYPGLSVAVNVASNTIQILAGWDGGIPLLQANPMSGSWSAGSILTGPEVTRLLLEAHMNAVTAAPANSPYLFPCVYNQDSGLWDFSPVSGPVLFTEVFINFYHDGAHHIDYLYDVGGNAATVQAPVCPFPRALYVLKEILRIGGYNTKGNVLNDAELWNLLIYTSHCIHKADMASVLNNDLYQLKFRIGDLLPKITVNDYIQALRKGFGIHYFFNDTTQECYVEFFDELIKSTDFVDWTSKVASKPTVSPCEPQGYLFTFDNDTSDTCIEEKVKSIENLNRILPDINEASISEFITLSPKANDIVHTKYEKNFYRAVFNFSGAFVSWDFHSVNFHPLKVGDGKTEVNCGFGSVTLHRGPYTSGASEEWIVPHTKQKLNPITPFEWDSEYHEFKLRLLFYRGMQPDNTSPHTYPFASFNDRDYFNNEITGTNYVLIWENEKGLYNKFWKAYTEWRKSAKEIDELIELTALDWINLDFRKKRQINGVNYFIKSVDMSFPIKGPARVILYKA